MDRHDEKATLLRRLNEAKNACYERLQNMPYPTHGIFCNRTWDNVLCWDDTRAGVTTNQTCPAYIFGHGQKGLAFRECMPDGTWYVHPHSNSSWTNYNACRYSHEPLYPTISKHLPYIRLMYNIGYGVSLVSVLIAMVIMVVCRLRSKSNTLHMNLFAAFVLRASVSFIKENTLVGGLGIHSEVIVDHETGSMILKNGTHWECKLMFTCFQYSITLSHIWIFVEGLYLHTLVYQTLWVERHGIKPFVTIGWTLPVLIVVPWAAMRATTEDTPLVAYECWILTKSAGVYWILRGPVVVTIIINFGFFLNILRMLVTRARSSHRQMNAKYRKMAKFIGALIPLFGMIYIMFLAVPHTLNEKWDVIYLYTEMFFNSTQGFVLALLFCFLNEEVHTKLRRMCARNRSRWAISNILSRSLNSSPTTRAPMKKKISRTRDTYFDSMSYNGNTSFNYGRTYHRSAEQLVAVGNGRSKTAVTFL